MNYLILLSSLAIAILLGLRGFFEIIGINSSTNLIAFLISLFLCFVCLNKKKVYFPLVTLFFLFLVTSFISSLFASASFTDLLSYNKTVIGFFITFLFALINLTDIRTSKIIRDFGVWILLIQIPVYVIKFLLIGFSEDPAGTISMRDGSATTIISIAGFSYYLINYLIEKKNTYLYLALSFILISQINEKRAILLLAPLFFFYIQYSLMKVDGKFRISIFLKNNFKYFIFGLPIFIYLIAIINPFLNQSGELFGEFDFEFLTSFIWNYVYRADLTVWDYSRFQSLFYLLGYSLNIGIIDLIFGAGAGIIQANTGGVTDFIGIRYGARMGVVWVFLQHGVIGVSIIIFMIRSLFKKIKLNSNFEGVNKEYLILKSYTLLLAFDFFIYSSVTLFYPVFIFIFLTQYNYVLKLNYMND
tara:strand:+ start:5614 stop:6861 length:1248 start_codon:yes stop_codon:yes gene_type:complete